MTAKSYVYLSPTEDEKSFKIGKANTPSDRLRKLSRTHDLHPTLTYLFECKNEHSAFCVESFLHRLFKIFSVKKEGDGGTEFFSAECWCECLKVSSTYAEAHKMSFYQYSSPRTPSQFPLPESSMNGLVAKIRRRRLALNFSQEDLAKRVGVGVATYRKFESCSGRQTALRSFISILKELGLESVISEVPENETFRRRAQRRRQPKS